jgi:hypothetical protein
LYPDRDEILGLFRVRLGLTARHGAIANSDIAYEHRARWTSGGAAPPGGQILPSGSEAPYRVAGLDWEIADTGDSFTYRHEIDRAVTALHPSWGEVTVGRQAIGLGRGVLFGAADVFAPFSPLEVDREWRRGVDAARVEVRLSRTGSLELIGVAGEGWDESAVLGRVRGYLGTIDGELILGKRARDAMAAGIVSAAVGDAEAHAEIACFDTPEPQPDGGFLGRDHLAVTALLGASYTFDTGNGLTLLGEYHYSGLGVEDIEDAALRLEDPDFQDRVLRGDTRILGQHVAALQASYPVTTTWSAALLLLQSPVDGSGLLTPSVRWDLTQAATLIASAYLPWGKAPSDGNLRSEYGGSPTSVFVQFNLYY